MSWSVSVVRSDRQSTIVDFLSSHHCPVRDGIDWPLKHCVHCKSYQISISCTSAVGVEGLV